MKTPCVDCRKVLLVENLSSPYSLADHNYCKVNSRLVPTYTSIYLQNFDVHGRDTETPCLFLSIHFCYSDATSFTKTVSRGGLLIAQPWVLSTIKLAETSLKRHIQTKGLQQQRLVLTVLLDVSSCQMERQVPYHPVVNSWEEDLHETSLIKRIVKRYINIRLGAIASRENVKIAGGCSIRTKFNKLILFNNV